MATTSEIIKYTDKDLEKIAKALNSLVSATKKEVLRKISVKTYESYYSEKKYIDFNETLRKFRVYKKYKGWTEPEW